MSKSHITDFLTSPMRSKRKPRRKPCGLIMVATLLSLSACTRMSNDFDEYLLACDIDATSVKGQRLYILEDSSGVISKSDSDSDVWQAAVVSPTGEIYWPQVTSRGCILVPEDLAGRESRLMARNTRSAESVLVGMDNLSSSGVLGLTPTKSNSQEAHHARELRCSAPIYHSNGRVRLTEKARDRGIFEQTIHHWELRNSQDLIVASDRFLQGEFPASALDLNTLGISDGVFQLKISNKPVFDPALESTDSCSINFDRNPPDFQLIIGKQMLLDTVPEVFEAEQGDQIEFFSNSPDFYLSYCFASGINANCDPSIMTSTSAISLPRRGLWEFRYYGSDLAGNRTDTYSLPLLVRQTSDVRAIRYSMASVDSVIDSNQLAGFSGLGSVIDTYRSLGSEKDKTAALGYINERLIDTAHKVRELARFEFEGRIAELKGRSDSDVFAVRIDAPISQTLVMDSELNLLAKYPGAVDLSFIDASTWWVFDAQLGLLTIADRSGSSTRKVLRSDFLPATMVLSADKKMLAGRTKQRNVEVYSLGEAEPRRLFTLEGIAPGISTGIEFNKSGSHILVRNDKKVIRVSTVDPSDRMVFELSSNAMVIDFKTYTRMDRTDISLISLMSTDASDSEATGLYAIEWFSAQMNEADAIDLNAMLINSNADPYYGVLMSKFDDPYHPVSYFFNYYSPYAYEVDLSAKKLQVDRLDIPLSQPDIDNRIAAEKLKDKELLTLRSRIYLEQVIGGAPYLYDPYPYVYGQSALLLEHGDKMAVITQNGLEIRSVYQGALPRAYSSYFAEIVDGLAVAKDLSRSGFAVNRLVSDRTRKFALPQKVGAKTVINLHKADLSVEQEIAVAANERLRGISWGGQNDVLFYQTSPSGDEAGPYRIYAYELDSREGASIVYESDKEIMSLFSHSALVDSVLFTEKSATGGQWELKEIDVFGQIRSFYDLRSLSPIEPKILDDNTFCLETSDLAKQVHCFSSSEISVAVKKFNINALQSHMALSGANILPGAQDKTCALRRLCRIVLLEKSMQDFLYELKSQTQRLESDSGSLLLGSSGVLDVTNSKSTVTSQLVNITHMGIINDQFWYAFSELGTLTIGDFEKNDQLFKIRPKHILENDLWYITYNEDTSKLDMFFTDPHGNIFIESLYLEAEKNIESLANWMSGYILKNMSDFTDFLP